MADEPIRIFGQCQDSLNEALSQLNLGSHIDLLIHTPCWLATSWELITTGYKSAPLVIINGQQAPLRSLESGADQHRWAIEPFWTQATLPEQQWLQISWKENTNDKPIYLQARDTISPWHLLQLLRSDVAQISPNRLRSWLFNSGLHESNLLRNHPAVLSSLNEPISSTNLPWFHWALHQQRQDLQASINPHNEPALLHWLIHHGATEHRLEPINKQGQLISNEITQQPLIERPFGVNLLGYASEAIGIGEDLRTVHIALKAAGIPVTVIDIPTHACSDDLRQQALYKSDLLAPYSFNLVCLTAEEHARVFLELGETIFQERYCIGYWPWELSRWPTPWLPLLALVDEVWSSSRHTHAALSEILDNRRSPVLQLYPLPLKNIKPLSEAEHQRWRLYFKLSINQPLVICSFDGRSSYARKNPWGAIQAFQEALPRNTNARLIIKTMQGSISAHNWQELKDRAANDPRLIIIDATLDRDELLGLYGCCNILLSLHRAEGYGRVIAEALALGLQVIATDYGGNTDFCLGPQAHLVQSRFIPVLPDEYPHSDNQHWADPDIEQAKRILKTLITQNTQATKISKKVDTSIYQRLFDPKAIGHQYSKRLQHLQHQQAERKIKSRWHQEYILPACQYLA